MKDYSTSDIRNVCLTSHGGAGKTTLTEAILFNAGAIDRMGKVMDGNTTSDFDPEEIKRQISVSTTLAPCEWKNHKINLIDTPGYFDFVGELKQGIRVADAALILVSAKSGVSVGTEKAWDYADELKIPKMIFINKIDDENANFTAAVEKIRTTFGTSVVPIQAPYSEGNVVKGYVDLVEMKAYKYEGGKSVETALTDAMKSSVSAYRDMLIEAVAEAEEELMDKFFNGEEFTKEELHRGLRKGIAEVGTVPVLCGSALQNMGVQPLMDAIADLLPAPDYKGQFKGKKPGSEEEITRKISAEEPVSALIFKTIADPYVGKISLFKVYSGILKPDSTVLNIRTGKSEKLAQIFTLRGKKQVPVDKAVAGDIVAVAKLQFSNTGDTLCDQTKQIEIEGISFPAPSISMGIEPKAKGDEEKIGSGLQKLLEEDPTFKIENNAEMKQLLISGIGEQHLDVIVSKLKTKFGVSVNLTDPRVPYRETIRKKVKIEGKHKKQSGGHGQFGHVWIEFEPGPTEDLTFEEKIFGGAVPRQYFPAVEKGLREAITKGVLAAYPVVNLKATLVDGSFHPVDSSEMAFKVAASLAYKKGMVEASPTLLEPIATVEVYIPDSYMGDIVGDLNKRRGRIMGMNPQEKGIQQVVAEVPMAEIFKYATDLRSLTQGRGSFSMKFERYEEAPSNIASKVIEEAKKHMKEEEEED
ncbi:MAG: elongation factor G [Deltaproteobacteria bacterium]